MFDKAKMLLVKRKIEVIKQKAQMEGRFSLFHSKVISDYINSCSNYEGIKYAYDLIIKYDEKCKIPYNAGMMLESLISEDSVMGIHRTNLYLDKNNPLDSDELKDIMANGLKNHGHLLAFGGGAVTDGLPSLSLTMTQFGHNTGDYINIVASYHDNDTVIIAKFPKDKNIKKAFIDTDLDLVNLGEVYSKGNPPRIKPEYIIGTLIKNTDGLDSFYSRDEILEHGLSK